MPIPDLLQFRRNVTVRHGLDELEKFISFELFRDKLEELCHFSSKGRPHYDVVQMFKVLMLQTLYNLRDEEMEFQLSDRLSFQRFVGIGYADNVSDARTIWKFRERLGEKGGCEELIADETAAQTTELLADSGYFGEEISKKIRAKCVKPRIVERRVRGQKKLTKWQERWNKAIAKRRCTIEHIFGAIKHFGGDIVRSIGLTRCRIRHGLVFMLYNMKRFCFLSRTGQLCPDGTK